MKSMIRMFNKNPFHKRLNILDKDLIVFRGEETEGEGCSKFMLGRDTIMEAINGDPDALDLVVAFYEPVIDKYSRRRVIDSAGKITYKVDKDVKTYLQLCLKAAVMNYKIR